jgi:hypothetical protein
MTSARRVAQDATLAGAVIVTGVALMLVPTWSGSLFEICRLAGFGAAIVMCVLVACRAFGTRVALERATVALFLGAMPLVYIVRWFEVDGAGSGGATLGAELGGLVVFGTVAVLGFKRSPWFLVGGIAAHGFVWDAWHWVFGSAFMFEWYAIGCLLCDFGLSLYLAFRIPYWRTQVLRTVTS